MPVLPFSETLRERTCAAGAAGDDSTFISELLTGKRTKEDYTALVAQQYFVYRELESVAARMASDPVAAAFVTSKLTRLPAIEADLEFLVGEDWAEQIWPFPATQRYVLRIRGTASWPGGFIAHHYTRYLGDLSGCNLIRTLLQRRFGFETNGVGFYLFSEIAEPRQFKDTYRAQLDAVDWDADEHERVIDEVARAARLNAEMFEGVALARAA